MGLSGLKRSGLTIYCIQWEWEDELPEMEDCEFDLIFAKSELRDGVRMYPYVWVEENGEQVKAFLA